MRMESDEQSGYDSMVCERLREAELEALGHSQCIGGAESNRDLLVKLDETVMRIGEFPMPVRRVAQIAPCGTRSE